MYPTPIQALDRKVFGAHRMSTRLKPIKAGGSTALAPHTEHSLVHLVRRGSARRMRQCTGVSASVSVLRSPDA